MSRRLDLIGIGPGNPDWLTLAGVDAIQHLDVLFVVLKEHDVDDLVEFRREVLRR
ncbi:SAM-dependent methyltransferase, partial [Acinetobacter baumannii]